MVGANEGTSAATGEIASVDGREAKMTDRVPMIRRGPGGVLCTLSVLVGGVGCGWSKTWILGILSGGCGI